MSDEIDRPKHYTSHPSGVECIEIAEELGFNLGNALKYVWRRKEKGAERKDLEKARFYVEREGAKRHFPVVLASRVPFLRSRITAVVSRPLDPLLNAVCLGLISWAEGDRMGYLRIADAIGDALSQFPGEP